VANYYLDTSALVKRYVTSEAGSLWVQQITDSAMAPLILMSYIGLVEVAAAFARKERDGMITASERRQYLGLFVVDCQSQFHLLPTTDIVLRLAAELTHRQALRAYDAVHLATALQANQLLLGAGAAALTFISSDGRLCSAAQAEGLTIDNPLAHP
jgi:predicted nucleic acid-binding protein